MTGIARLWCVLAPIAAACGDEAPKDQGMLAPGMAPPSVPPAQPPAVPQESVADASNSPPQVAPDDDAGSEDDSAAGDAGSIAADSGLADASPDAASSTRGELLDSCERDSDCAGALLCREGGRSTPGYCTQACTADGDCSAPGSVCLRGGVPSICALPCGDDSTCPAPMQCLPVIGETLRCGHPPPPPAGPFERCSLSADNCEQGYACYRSAYSEVPGPGYCAPSGCSGAGDCTAFQPAGVTAPLGCFQGVCRFECETGACPDEMFCELMSPPDIEPFERCHYAD